MIIIIIIIIIIITKIIIRVMYYSYVLHIICGLASILYQVLSLITSKRRIPRSHCASIRRRERRRKDKYEEGRKGKGSKHRG